MSYLCNHRRNKNVLSCKDLAIGDLVKLSSISCLAAGVACKSQATFKAKVWNTFEKTITYSWTVVIGAGASGTTSAMIDGPADEDTITIWIHSATNIPVEVTCTVSDGTHTDTMMVEYISENE